MSAVPVSDQSLDQLTSLFRLLGDKTRLNIVLLLAQGERNVTSLTDALSLPQPTVSHHLGLLRMHNVIGNRRNGKQVFYTLSGPIGVDSHRGMTIDVGEVRILIHREGARAQNASANVE
ncbi:MAG: metalloregulator ArsR/SmtB family transcription factor [Phycisphaerae bacterium]|nr:metalloregulator ArsR/SmtB family transcription factor [Phycisphaerae bacterium]